LPYELPDALGTERLVPSANATSPGPGNPADPASPTREDPFVLDQGYVAQGGSTGVASPGLSRPESVTGDNDAFILVNDQPMPGVASREGSAPTLPAIIPESGRISLTLRFAPQAVGTLETTIQSWAGRGNRPPRSSETCSAKIKVLGTGNIPAVNPPPPQPIAKVNLSATSTSQSIAAGQGVDFTIALERTNFQGTIDLSVSAVPVGATAALRRENKGLLEGPLSSTKASQIQRAYGRRCRFRDRHPDQGYKLPVCRATGRSGGITVD
jgi:hypothetical protein